MDAHKNIIKDKDGLNLRLITSQTHRPALKQIFPAAKNKTNLENMKKMKTNKH